ncbi:MAG: toll/interleukin-1 receptor domain-containing protein, partial [Burkholderiales bacterium]|nr:toll/interleukin-1 receptor domain-containing protein [Anaerolineae bacterium]
MRLFISYSSRDRDAADFLADALQERGATVFIDYERLKVGKSFSDQLRDEILACDGLILLISPRSVASEWVQAEVNWAKHNDKLIVPVELEKTPEYKTVFWNLIHIERLDFTRWNTDRQMDEALKKLERSLGFVSSEDTPDVPSAAVDLAPVPPITTAPLTSSDANTGKAVGREQTADTQNGWGKSRRNRFEIIGLILAALGVLVAVLAIPSAQWQNWGHTFGLVPASPTYTPSPTETSIPTATERPTPTDTPTTAPT